MYQICICDDEPVFSEKIRKAVETFFSHNTGMSICSYTDPELLWQECPNAQLYLLDVMMPGLTGLEFAGRLRACGSRASIIFISSLNDPVFDSFQYQPLRYIRKEYLDRELPAALQAFMELQEEGNCTFCLVINGKEVFIPLLSLLYCESRGHYVTFYCKHGEYEVRGKLADYEKKLKKHHIVQPNKSFLVNMRYISLFSNQSILMENGTVVTVTRTYKEDFKMAFMKYQRNYHYDNTI